MMLRISKAMFGVYVFLLILHLGFHFTFISLILMAVFLTSIALIIILIQLLVSIKRKEAIRQRLLTVAILLAPLTTLFFYGKANSVEEKRILSAYTDGVISGADITFYENNKMKYCSMDLMGERCYTGSYELKGDTFLVTYTNRLPNLKSTKMIKRNDRLMFINDKDEIEYKFYLDNLK